MKLSLLLFVLLLQFQLMAQFSIGHTTITFNNDKVVNNNYQRYNWYNQWDHDLIRFEHSGPKPLSILEGTVSVLPHFAHLPSCHISINSGSLFLFKLKKKIPKSVDLKRGY